MLTPGYQSAKKANMLASNVSENYYQLEMYSVEVPTYALHKQSVQVLLLTNAFTTAVLNPLVLYLILTLKRTFNTQ